MQRAGSGGGQSKRNALNPRRANPCISIVFSEPRKTGACGAEARMHGLGTLTRGTQRILATSPLRCGLSPQRKPPRRERSPGRIAHAERRESPKRTRPTDPTPARVPSGWRVGAGESQHAARQNRPGPMRRARGRMPHVGGRERPTRRSNRQSAPWRQEDAQGALAFRIVYLSFGASFTSCPRLATTGMVIALAGQASTQALQRVQSASVRSP